MKLTREDFELWRHQGLTELILDRYVAARMNAAKAVHDAEAWSGPLEPERHASLREHYETLESIRDLTFDELHEWLKTEVEQQE
jgi:hypothetical protein